MKRDTRLEFSAEQLFDLAYDRWRYAVWSCWCVRRRLFGVLGSLRSGGLYPPFHFADGKPVGCNFAGEVSDGSFGAQPQQRARVSGGELLLLQEPADRCRELKQAKRVGHGRAVFSDNVCDFLLGEQKLFHQSLVAVGFFDRIEIGSLEVFDHRECERGAIVGGADDRGDFGPSESCCGPEATFSGDEFKAAAVWRRANRDRLEESVNPKARLEVR